MNIAGVRARVRVRKLNLASCIKMVIVMSGNLYDFNTQEQGENYMSNLVACIENPNTDFVVV